MNWSDCPSGKKCYTSKEQAESELIIFRNEGNFRQGSGPINVYQCQTCDEWHFTSKGAPSIVLNAQLDRKEGSITSEAKHWESKLKRR